jgi:hypothetical protein
VLEHHRADLGALECPCHPVTVAEHLRPVVPDLQAVDGVASDDNLKQSYEYLESMGAE